MQTNNSSKNIELGFGKLLNEINQHFSFIQEFNPGLIERETQKIEDKTYRTDVMFDYHLNMARFHNDKLDVENLSKFINKKHKGLIDLVQVYSTESTIWCMDRVGELEHTIIILEIVQDKMNTQDDIFDIGLNLPKTHTTEFLLTSIEGLKKEKSKLWSIATSETKVSYWVKINQLFDSVLFTLNNDYNLNIKLDK
jgi:hypothetical protein